MQAVLNYLQRLWQIVKEFWQKTERKDRMRFIAISSVALVGVVVAIVMLTRTNYVVLYTGVEDAQIGEITELLTAAGVRSKVEGNTILVPEGSSSIRFTLAQQGYPKSGYSHEYLANIVGFGVTEDQRKLYKRIDREEQIRADLMTSPKIQNASVKISEPENTNVLLKNEKIPITSSVTLTLTEALTQEEVNGVVTMVSTSYTDLLPENVSVVDQNMNLLNYKSPTDIDLYASYNEIKQQTKTMYEQSLNAIFVPIFGANRYRSQVYVDLDFSNHTTEKETFEPVVDDEGIARSIQRISESAVGGYVGEQVGEDANGGDLPLYDETGESGDNWEYLSETINYDITRIVEFIEKEKGARVNVTAAIVVDSNELSKDLNNTKVIQELAAGILGLSKAEINNVAVSILPLEGLAKEQEAIDKINAQKEKDARNAFILALVWPAVILICAIILIWRIFKLFHKGPSEEELLEMQRAAEMEDLDEYADLVKLASATADIEEAKTPERMKIEDFVERSPEMVANLLRTWMSEETPRRR